MSARLTHLLPRLIPAAALIASACAGVPEGVIPTDGMADLMADLYVGETVIDNTPQRFPTDSAKRAFKQSIYARHGVSTETVDSSLNWYGLHIEEYMKVCDATQKILQARIAEAERKGAKATDATRVMSVTGDSVNLWTGPSMRRNSTLMPSEFITFSLSRDKNWEAGDRYALTAHGVMTRGPVDLTLAVDYRDGTTEYVTMSRRADERKERLVLVLDSLKTPATVYGYVHYSAEPGEVSYLDSLSLTRTRGRNDNMRARQGQLTTIH